MGQLEDYGPIKILVPIIGLLKILRYMLLLICRKKSRLKIQSHKKTASKL